MPASPRHQYAARKAGAAGDLLEEYIILDPHHLPDLNGEFAGAKVYRIGAEQRVKLLAAQAKFYLDQGAIKKAAII